MATVMIIPAKKQMGNTIKKPGEKKLRVAAYYNGLMDLDHP